MNTTSSFANNNRTQIGFLFPEKTSPNPIWFHYNGSKKKPNIIACMISMTGRFHSIILLPLPQCNHLFVICCCFFLAVKWSSLIFIHFADKNHSLNWTNVIRFSGFKRKYAHEISRPWIDSFVWNAKHLQSAKPPIELNAFSGLSEFDC